MYPWRRMWTLLGSSIVSNSGVLVIWQAMQALMLPHLRGRLCVAQRQVVG